MRVKSLKCVSFLKAREIVEKLGLKNVKEWREYCKSGNKSNK